jgi:transposase-like protein
MESMTRRQHSAQFKAKVALEALKGQNTVNERASKYGVHPSQITRLKQQLPAEVRTSSPTAKGALEAGKPEIFNSGQGAQFTSQAFTGTLEEAGVAISMDGQERAFDNIYVEGLWGPV